MNTPIQEWMREHPVGLDMLWEGPAGAQLGFVRDTLARGLMGRGLDLDAYEEMNVCTVISEHMSKSIELPVYSIYRPDWGLRLVLRDNFYNWKLSVISEKPVLAMFDDLFYCHPPREPDYTGDSLSSVYFEGFPGELIFGYYGPSDKKQWSAQIGSKYTLYMVIVTILRALGRTAPLRQHTKEEHAAELAERSAQREMRAQ
jgi:hypothetical protein